VQSPHLNHVPLQILTTSIFLIVSLQYLDLFGSPKPLLGPGGVLELPSFSSWSIPFFLPKKNLYKKNLGKPGGYLGKPGGCLGACWRDTFFLLKWRPTKNHTLFSTKKDAKKTTRPFKKVFADKKSAFVGCTCRNITVNCDTISQVRTFTRKCKAGWMFS